MKKVLIIGASGLVGGNIYKFLSSQQDYLVAGTYNKHNAGGLLFLDLCDRSTLKYVSEESWDVIIHTAALTHVDLCEENPALSYEVNVENTSRVIELALKAKAKLLFISTDYVFDGKDGPYSEEDETKPINIYGFHKLTCENLIQSAMMNHSLIVRVTNVYGDEWQGKNFLARLIASIQSLETKTIEVPIDQWATPVNAWDIGRSIYELLEVEKVGIYHISGFEYLSRYELAHLVTTQLASTKLTIVPKTTAELNQKALRPLRGGLNNEKFCSEFPNFRFSTVQDYINEKRNV